MSITDTVPARVEAVYSHCADTRSLTFRLEKKMVFSAGQFIMVNIPYKNTVVRRAYSIASTPSSTTMEICLNAVPGGLASSYLFGLSVGASVVVDGPWGVFTLKKNDKDKWFIATGTGVAPLRSMIHDLLEHGFSGRVYLVFGERTEADLLYRSEFEELSQKHSNFVYIPTLSRAGLEWDGEEGHVQKAIQKYLKEPTKIEVYICGLKGMVDDVKQLLVSLNVSEKDIFTERFV